MTDNTHDSMNAPTYALITAWPTLWNGALELATQLCAPDMRVRFGARAVGIAGDQVGTPDELASLIGEFRSTRAGLTYSIVEAEATPQWGYCVWDASHGDRHVGGIDTFTFIDGRISHVYSVTGERPMSQ